MKKTCEPKWNQTFVYTHVHRRDFRNHMLELTVWDQPRSSEEDSAFMGEVTRDALFFFAHLVFLKGLSKVFLKILSKVKKTRDDRQI